VQANVLDRGPDNREATRLRRKHINLIGALPHIDTVGEPLGSSNQS